ncbi:MAG: hypothetical protein ACOC5R_01650 [Elusimicrobiota bacterium]
MVSEVRISRCRNLIKNKGRLSKEYRKKSKENPKFVYKKTLNKLSTVGIMNIPQVDRKEKKLGKTHYLLIYGYLTILIAGVFISFLDPRYLALRVPGIIIVVIYISVRVATSPKVRKINNW